jgi:uncharacterized membrane protein
MKINWGFLIGISIGFLILVGLKFVSIIYLLGMILTYLEIKFLNQKFKNDKCLNQFIFKDVLAIIFVATSWVGLFVYNLMLLLYFYFVSENCKEDKRMIFEIMRSFDDYIKKIF